MSVSTIPGEIISLGVPDIEKVVLAGSGVLELSGIRVAADIDLVTNRLNSDFLLETEPERWSKEVHHFRRIRDNTRFQRTSVVDTDNRFDIWQTWYHAGRPLGDRQLSVDDLISESFQHKAGFYVVKLAFMIEMKFWANRDKDREDVHLYNQFLASSPKNH